MDLGRAMLALARRLDQNTPADVLTELVRAELLTESAGADSADLYQRLLGYVIHRSEDGTLEARFEPRAHRASGAYYTAESIVRYMLHRCRTLLPEAASVIDPACGSGAFLAGAAMAFPGARLTGLDADPTALALCAQRVPSAQLETRDALLDHLPDRYDLCVGNPPYISSGLRGAAPSDPERAAVLRKRFPQTAQYKLNTYPLFVERGLELLRPGGLLAFILPDSFLAGRYFAGMRRLLLAYTVLELTLIRKDFWSYGHVGQSVILIIRKSPPPAGYRVAVRLCKSVTDLETTPAAELPIADIFWGPLQRFRLTADPETRRLLKAMDAAPGVRPLGDLVRTYSGLIGRNGQASLLRSANPHLAGPWAPLLRSGKEVDRYRVAWGGEEVCLDPSLIKSGGRLDLYQNPKLLLRQTADALRAAYDDQGYFCLNNLHLLIPREGAPDLRGLLGVINSRLADRYYRAVTMETGRLYAQVDLDLLACLPIPPLPEGLPGLVRARESAAPAEAALLERSIDAMVADAYGWRER